MPALDGLNGRIAALEGPPPEEPESKPYLPLLCEYEIALTAREVRAFVCASIGR